MRTMISWSANAGAASAAFRMLTKSSCPCGLVSVSVSAAMLEERSAQRLGVDRLAEPAVGAAPPEPVAVKANAPSSKKLRSGCRDCVQNPAVPVRVMGGALAPLAMLAEREHVTVWFGSADVVVQVQPEPLP
jgi:hypothetical protein